MASILFKWLLVCALNMSSFPAHPIFVSVTQIEHNVKEKSLEISCKIFTDDFEKLLRSIYKTKIDLLDTSLHDKMSPMLNDYICKHLQIAVNEQPVQLNWIGYEQKEEGIMNYFQVQNVAAVTSLQVINNILYEYKQEQISLIHAIVNGKRKSVKLNNPEEKTTFNF